MPRLVMPTIVLVRVSMELPFHDEPSLVETVGSLRFGDADPNSFPSLRRGVCTSGIERVILAPVTIGR